jgi:hypothetical protein
MKICSSCKIAREETEFSENDALEILEGVK